jgi:hypothetical protein
MYKIIEYLINLRVYFKEILKIKRENVDGFFN